MCQRQAVFLFGLLLLCTPVLGQLRGQVRDHDLSSPRSGLGFRSNPIANPAPSLTPSEIFNPRGSLSAGQVLNPKSSLHRPRSGGASPANNTQQPIMAVRYQAAQPIADDSKTANSGAANVDNAVLRAISPAPRVSSAGEKILESVIALDHQITEVAPNKGWSERLSLDQLRDTPVFSDQPADAEQRTALEKILKTYQAVANEEQSAVVSKFPEFEQVVNAIQEYLTPIDVRQRRSAAAAFQQLASNLRAYKNGEVWVEYLVPTEMTTPDAKASMSKEQLEKQIKRFHKVARDPVYAKVTSLAGFQPAHEALKATVVPKP